jgi:hypothetical protein
LQEFGDTLAPLDDFTIQANGLELAFRAARELGVPATEIHACLVREDLRPPKLETAVHGARIDDLRRLTRRMSAQSTANDALLFIAVNHGSIAGITTAQAVADEFDDEVPSILTPEMLDDCLSAIQGVQVLVLSICHAGTFLPLAKSDQRMVLAACASEEVHFVSREDQKWCSFLDELFGAWCACSLSDVVPPMRLSPSEAFETAKQRLTAVASRSSPLAAGSICWPSEQ